jgi:hypothetical protein
MLSSLVKDDTESLVVWRILKGLSKEREDNLTQCYFM